ncbi:DUF3703 domain-containing protein [Actinomadura barringtoniae]|uniref:DUF3703 domain-containing protein n=1 Tax=Actinomadura barringtoniae TaxID=1427535 RepID=A0A939TEG6_9ACTN|nr:DUF3703 domain-containing protein [Actinomadura barringtoniae]MBO2453340.1 DUF3703 domain-containing protein [Actinomadura barringtoniae]
MSQMPPQVRTAFEDELRKARTSTDPEAMWRALERAHILSQSWAWPHTRAHWHMLVLAVRCRDRTEAFGQVIRLLVGGPGSLMGRAPRGNTGRTGVGINTVMPIPDDLAVILNGINPSQEVIHRT